MAVAAVGIWDLPMPVPVQVDSFSGVGTTLFNMTTAPDGKLFVSFYRSPHAKQNVYKSGTKAYEFTLRLEGDPKQLGRVKQVHYKRMYHTFPEYKNNTWLVKTSRQNHFASVWTGWGNSPVKVKIFFNDGSVKELYIDESPTVAGK